MSRTRFSPEKPCDIIAGIKGRSVLIELKQIKKWQAFGKTQMRGSQILNLTEAMRSGSACFVFLNVRIRAIKGLSKHENKLLIFDWAKWGDILSSGTIKAKELVRIPYIEGSSKGGFDLTSFFNSIVGIEGASCAESKRYT
jgi:hypothetical protein